MKIDREFKDLIPPLDEAEYKQLEANIIKEGCREALIIWNNILIDGHHRYRICTEHNIPFKTSAMDFKDRQSVKEWIITNQWGRRNLTSYQRAVLALKLESALREKAKQNQSDGGKGLSTLTEVNVRKEVAKIAGLSTGTIWKVKKIEESATEKQKKALREGKVTASNTFREIQAREDREKRPEHEIGDLERKAILDRCIVDLKTCSLTLERQGVDISGLRTFIKSI